FAAANDILFNKLNEATKDFLSTVVIDTNNMVTNINNVITDTNGVITDINYKVTDGFDKTDKRLANMEAALQIMLTQKGNNVTDKDIESLKLDPTRFYKSSNPEIRKNIEKQVYIGDSVAVKKLPSPPDLNLDLQLRNIAKQAKIISLLSTCNHIEKLQADGMKHLFVVTKWMKYGNLRDYLIENKQIEWSTKLEIAKQIALGLEFCNAANVYHRDVKRSETSLSESNDLDDQLMDIEEVKILHETKQYKKAYRHFLKLAHGNDPKTFPLASYYAGIYLFEGTYEIEYDEFQAFQLFKRSAIGGCVEGQYMYAYVCLKGANYYKEEGIKYLKIAAMAKKYPAALYMVAEMFLNGEHGYKEDRGKYIEYLKQAAEAEYPDALYDISRIYLTGEYSDYGYLIDNDKYKQYLMKAAEKGSEKATKELAMFEF
ncbi:168_t:CDS:2, partial [Acaulospora colombiana]